MARKANRQRGEHELRLPGATYLLRPSHAALTAIEELTRPVLVLIRLGNVGELTLRQLGLIAAELIRAGADDKDELTRAVDAERIEELIFENADGIPYVTSTLTLCLMDAATGGRKASGEAKAAPAGPETGQTGAASAE